MPGSTDETSIEASSPDSDVMTPEEREAERVAGRRTWLMAIGAPILVLCAAALTGTVILLVFDYVMRH